MKLRKAITIALLAGLLQACSSTHPDLKSPCAGNAGSPCGPRHPVNDWWLHPADEG